MNGLPSAPGLGFMVVALLMLAGGALIMQNLREGQEESARAELTSESETPVAAPSTIVESTSTPVDQAQPASGGEPVEGLPSGALIDSYAEAERHAIEILSAVNPRDISVEYMSLSAAFENWGEGRDRATTFDGFSQSSLDAPVWIVSLDADEISSFASCPPPPPDVEIDMTEYCTAEPPAELIIRASNGSVVSARVNANLANADE